MLFSLVRTARPWVLFLPLLVGRLRAVLAGANGTFSWKRPLRDEKRALISGSVRTDLNRHVLPSAGVERLR